MSKFSDFDKKHQIDLIKSEFGAVLESFAGNPDLIKTYLKEEERVKAVESFVNSHRENGCECGTCVDLDAVFSDDLPEEIQSVIDAVRDNLQQKDF